jgi:hypothetical protein
MTTTHLARSWHATADQGAGAWRGSGQKVRLTSAGAVWSG